MPAQKYQMTIYINEAIKRKIAADATRSFNSSEYIRQLIEKDLEKPEKEQLFTKINEEEFKQHKKKEE